MRKIWKIETYKMAFGSSNAIRCQLGAGQVIVRSVRTNTLYCDIYTRAHDLVPTVDDLD